MYLVLPSYTVVISGTDPFSKAPPYFQNRKEPIMRFCPRRIKTNANSRIKAIRMPILLQFKFLVISDGYTSNKVKQFTNMKNNAIFYVIKYYSLVIDMAQRFDLDPP